MISDAGGVYIPERGLWDMIYYDRSAKLFLL